MGSGYRDSAKKSLASANDLYGTMGDTGSTLTTNAAKLIGDYTKYQQNLAKGGRTATQAAMPLLNQISQQYSAARSRAKDMASGGSRDRTMRELAIGEAGAKANALNGVTNQANAALGQLGTSTMGTGLGAIGNSASGYGNSAQTYSDMGQQVAGMWSAGIGAIGSAAGMGMGMLGGLGKGATKAAAGAGGIGMGVNSIGQMLPNMGASLPYAKPAFGSILNSQLGPRFSLD